MCVYMAPLPRRRRSCVGSAVLCVALTHSTPIFRSVAFDLSPWCELNARSTKSLLRVAMVKGGKVFQRLRNRKGLGLDT